MVCYLALILKNKLGYDDTLDAFGIHGVGGILGAILLAFFIRGESFSWNQLGVQALAVIIAAAYAAVVTLLILYVMNKFTNVRATKESEMKGLDDSFHGERGYGMLNPN